VAIIRNSLRVLRVISSRRNVRRNARTIIARYIFTFSFVIRYYFLAPPLVWRGGIRAREVLLTSFRAAAEDQGRLVSVYIFNFNLIFRRSSLRGFVRIVTADAVIVSKSAWCVRCTGKSCNVKENRSIYTEEGESESENERRERERQRRTARNR